MTKQDLRAFRNKSREIAQLKTQLIDVINLSAPISSYEAVKANKNGDGSPVERQAENLIKVAGKYEKRLNEYAAERLKIESAIEILTPNERAVLRAYYFDNLSWEDAAERLNISLRHIHRLHARALQKLLK